MPSITLRVMELKGQSLSTMDMAFLGMMGMKVPMNKNATEPMTLMDWLKEPQFYLVAAIDNATTLFVGISQSYIVFYIQDTLALPKEYVSIIPLVMYITGLLMSSSMKVIYTKFGMNVSMILSGIVGIGILNNSRQAN